MSNGTEDTSIYGGMGEFVSQTENWTDEEWAEYDAQVAQEIAEWESQTSTDWLTDDSLDIEPPF